MITITKTLYENMLLNNCNNIQDKIPANIFEILPASVFFDIETTGLSPKNSMCYLIGAIYIKNHEWYYTQWFANKPDSESEIINSFFDFIYKNGYQYLFHFNGDTFDIPFLENRCSLLNLAHSFNTSENDNKKHIKSIDILKRIRKISNILNLENYKQKTIEQFLNINREDKYTGGDLIKIYKQYVIDNDINKKNLLLLHNHDDIMGLLNILPILCFENIYADQLFSIEKIEENEARAFDGSLKSEILITCQSAMKFPVRISFHIKDYLILAENNILKLRIPVINTELKHFYSNYKDYYYLPDEDTAIYKSVASYVDRTHRKQATAANCYVKKTGDFIMQPENIVSPVFKNSYKDTFSYFELNNNFLTDKSLQTSLVKSILKSIN